MKQKKKMKDQKEKQAHSPSSLAMGLLEDLWANNLTFDLAVNVSGCSAAVYVLLCYTNLDLVPFPGFGRLVLHADLQQQVTLPFPPHKGLHLSMCDRGSIEDEKIAWS